MKHYLFVILMVFFFSACNSGGRDDKLNKETEVRIDSIIDQMTLEEKVEMIGGYQGFNIRPLERLQIPEVRMSDGPCGVRNKGKSTAYPAPVNTAASWDTSMARLIGQSIGKEARAKDVQIMLAPAMNIYRAPMCGRNFEYLGEDPFLAGTIASSIIRGMQGEGVMSTAKHYDANNQEYERHKVSSDMDERTLHEIYLPAFRSSVHEGRVACVMTSYNLVNGIHASQNEYLIRDILKDGWKFNGFVMSDWVSVYNGVAAANAGLDLEMPSGIHMCPDTLIPAIEAGKVKEGVIDDKIRRMLRMYFRFGLMNGKRDSRPESTDTAALAGVALDAARDGIVLLKNEQNVLPVDRKRIRSMAVLGPNADPAVTGGGGSSYVDPYHAVSVLDGIRHLAGKEVKISYAEGPFQTYDKRFFDREYFQGDGLKGEYFSNDDFEGEPTFTRTDPVVDLRWNEKTLPEGFPRTNFTVRWTGTFKAPATGDYRFVIEGDDGFRFFLDGKPLIDRWHYESDKQNKADVTLQAGKTYDIRLDYYQGLGGGYIRMGVDHIREDRMKKAVELARNADVAILCVGFDRTTEGEGHDRPYGLPDKQVELIRKVSAVNRNVIAIVNAGGNVGLNEWVGDVKGLLFAWYPGEMGGQAIAEILFGEVNPSGKLPMTFEKRWEDSPSYGSYYDKDHDDHVEYTEGIYAGYRHYDHQNIDPLFPFGFGLSYTTFDYGNIAVDRNEFTAGQGVTVSFDIKNTGDIAGKEIAQVYVSDPVSSLPRPEKELKGFAKVSLQPGETKRVSIHLDQMAFSFYDPEKHTWTAEPGEFMILPASSSRNIRLEAMVKLKK